MRLEGGATAVFSLATLAVTKLQFLLVADWALHGPLFLRLHIWS